MKNYLLLLAIAAPLVFTACKKDDEEEVTPAQTTTLNPIDYTNPGSSDPAAMQLTTDLLTSTKWKLTDLYQASTGTLAYKDLYSKLPACQKDDIYEFSKTGNGLVITDGINYCNGILQPKNGSWNLKNSANITISAADLTQAGLTGEFNISHLSESELVLKQTVNGSVYVSIYAKHIPSNAELLMNKNWRLTAETEQVGSNPMSDLYATYPACKRDNFIRFEGTGILKYDEGPTKCNSNDPQTTSETYYYNGYYINKSSQTSQQYTYIQSINATTLVLRTTDYGQGNNMNRISTYTTF